MVSLEEWGKAYFSPAPSLWTLRKMVREHRISPQPTKIGKAYYVTRDAEVVDPAARPSLVQRLRHA